jgi:hypothetical protein
MKSETRERLPRLAEAGDQFSERRSAIFRTADAAVDNSRR